jgi:hypothetical protein
MLGDMTALERRARRRNRPATRWLLPLIVLVGMAASTAACGGGSSPGSAAGAPSSSPHSTTTTSHDGTTGVPAGFRPGAPYPGVDLGHVVPKSSTPTTVPVEIPSHPLPIASTSTLGQQVLIEKKGFAPTLLYADIGEPLVWTNESGVPMKIQVFDYRVTSPVIPPGAQFVWTPPSGGTISVVSAAGFTGDVHMS